MAIAGRNLQDGKCQRFILISFFSIFLSPLRRAAEKRF
jgi:hypothetical protein